MRDLVFAIGIASALGGAMSVPAQDKKKDDRPVIVVTGCVEGSWLRVHTVDTSGSYVQRYRLHGAKQLLKEMETDYKGHVIEVTGAVTDTGGTTHRGKTIQVGKKTRITSSAKDAPQIPSGTGDPILEVGSFRDLKDSCK